MTATQPRPRVVDTAFWLLLVGAALLLAGGLLAATLSFDTVRQANLIFHRGVGVGCVLAGAGLGFLAGRTRTGDARFHRATIGLSMAIVVLVALVAVFAGIHVLSLLALLPIIVGSLLLTRPTAMDWFAADGQRNQPDG